MKTFLFDQKAANKYTVVMLGLAVVLVLSLFVCLYEPDVSVYAAPVFFSVDIVGPEKLYVNTPETFTASVSGSSVGRFSYSWSVDPPDNKIVLTPDGVSCVVEFVEPTSDIYLLRVEVKDQASGYGGAVKPIQDPASFPSLYLNVHDSSYDFTVYTDESGAYYYPVNGKTGAVGTPGTNLTTVTSTVLSGMTSGSLLLKGVPFNLALMNSIPVNVRVVCSYGDEYYEYINSADSLGSPSSVSVGAGVNAGYYLAADSGNRIVFTSINKTLVLVNVASNGNAFDTVLIKSGVVGSGESVCVLGTASEALAAGQPVYYNTTTSKYSLTDASANSTVGYGHVWLNILTANINAKTLLLGEGYFILASWTWTAPNPIWISTDTGGLTETYPSGTGNQLVQIGYANSATEMKFVNPNGFYMEHI